MFNSKRNFPTVLRSTKGKLNIPDNSNVVLIIFELCFILNNCVIDVVESVSEDCVCGITYWHISELTWPSVAEWNNTEYFKTNSFSRLFFSLCLIEQLKSFLYTDYTLKHLTVENFPKSSSRWKWWIRKQSWDVILEPIIIGTIASEESSKIVKGVILSERKIKERKGKNYLFNRKWIRCD